MTQRLKAAPLVAFFAASLALAGCESMPRVRAPWVRAPAVCVDVAISIYFEAQSAVVTREARQMVDTAARRLKRCDVTGIDIVGLADAPGGPEINVPLSKARAEAVTALLDHRGFKDLEFRVAAGGDAGAQTASGEARPLRRRVDVTFHVSPPAH